LTTPVGGGIRSLNVTLRQVLDLYSCIRPVRYFQGTPAPVSNPERMNSSSSAKHGRRVRGESNGRRARRRPNASSSSWRRRWEADRAGFRIGIKPMSETGTKRLVRMAIQYALANNRRIVTIVHKGNIMKFTEGAFRDWGYEVASRIRDQIVTRRSQQARQRDGKLVITTIADSVFQQF